MQLCSNIVRKTTVHFDFHTDFESKLDPDNRWVKMAKLLDWDKLAEFMLKFFFHHGASSIDARIVIGALIITFRERRSWNHSSYSRKSYAIFLGLDHLHLTCF